MNLSAPFIVRPVATGLLMLALAVLGIGAYRSLPVAALPQVDVPTISVTASFPGANAETMASTIAQPLERQFATLPGVAQITSTSVLGTTSIVVQFDLSRNQDGAAGDVQQAINAANGFLPKDIPNSPTYVKVNPADQPVLVLGVRSDELPLTQVNEYADTNLAQRLSLVPGVAQVNINGAQKFSPTIRLNPAALAAKGIGMDEVAAVITNSTALRPLGTLQGPRQVWQISADGQVFNAEGYANLIVAWRNGAPVRVRDVGDAQIGAENPLIASWVGRERGIILAVQRQTGSNMVELVDRIRAELPRLQETIPSSVKVEVISDRTTNIRAAISDVKLTLLLTIGLVVAVIFVFLRRLWATVIPSVAVPLSLVATFAAMLPLGYSLDNLSLMGLTLAVGLVVDDAVVMVENIVRHIEDGDEPLEAALKGAGEIGFTILSITISLVAVFIPLLFMGGIVGRILREFAVVVTVAIVASAAISLTLTPMMAALLLKSDKGRQPNRLYQWSERVFDRLLKGYESSLRWTLRHRLPALLLVAALAGVSAWQFVAIPKGFLPNEDTGFLFGFTEGAQDISFDGMAERQQEAAAVVLSDPDVAGLGSSIGAGGSNSVPNTGKLFINLKPFAERKATAEQVIARLRPRLAALPGFKVTLQVVQNIQIGGRLARSQYQYTLQDIDMGELREWGPRLEERLRGIPGLLDVASDQEVASPQLSLKINRDRASRLNLTPFAIEEALYYAFGRRWVTELYGTLNTYHVMVEVGPQYQRDPSALSRIYVRSSAGALVPLTEFASLEPEVTSLAVNHQSQFPAITVSFNLAPGMALGDAVDRIRAAEQEMGKPQTLMSSFQGTAQAFQSSLAGEPLLIAAAIFAVYCILGMLYESLIHPVTILLSLPPASVGALLALDLFGMDLSLIAVIGLIMLIGIVKKNAIMMIDFALERQRQEGHAAEAAITEAASLRFRPILMTSFAAILGTLPIAIGAGAGAELRQPLGIAVVGGLLLSQFLTLYTVPVTFLYMDRLSVWLGGLAGAHGRAPAERVPEQAR